MTELCIDVNVGDDEQSSLKLSLAVEIRIMGGVKVGVIRQDRSNPLHLPAMGTKGQGQGYGSHCRFRI